jgi:hypothetical protein
MKKVLIVLVVFIDIVIAQEFYYYQKNRKIELIPQPLQRDRQCFYYRTKEGRLLGISNKILVKSENDMLLKKYLNEYDLSIVKVLSKQLYLIEVTDKNVTLDIANQLNGKEGIVYAHPDFKKSRILR